MAHNNIKPEKGDEKDGIWVFGTDDVENRIWGNMETQMQHGVHNGLASIKVVGTGKGHLHEKQMWIQIKEIIIKQKSYTGEWMLALIVWVHFINLACMQRNERKWKNMEIKLQQ